MEEDNFQELKERELTQLIEWEEHKSYMRQIKKYGVPKTEQEREELICRAEENVAKRKDVRKCMNEFLGLE